MQVSDARAAELKTWVTKKLEDISDADADVLADYVLALVRSDIPAPDLRRSVIENLEDFLRGNTAAFVDQLLSALNPQLKTKAINPAAPSFTPSKASGPNAPFAAALGGSAAPKRPLHGVQSPTSPMRHRGRNERAAKSLRGGVAMRGFGGRVAKGSQTRQKSRQGIPFDPQQAAAALWTLESMGFPVPPLPMDPSAFAGQESGSVWSSGGKGKGKGRCKDYDTVGICQRGANCPYLHDANQIIMPFGGEHSSATPAANGQLPDDTTQKQKGAASRDKANGRPRRVGSARAGPGDKPSVTSIVVKNIPEEYLNEGSIKHFFATFGNIQEIHMTPERRLAVVNYESNDAAAAAYESPKVIFDNRFVKVHWNSTNKRHRSPEGPESEAASFDQEAFERELEAHQKRFEERKALKDETGVKVAEIQQQREEVERKREEERQRLLTRIREKRPSEDTSEDAKSSTEFLRAKLKWLEEEAASLGLQPEPWSSGSARGGFGRGAYQGRGAFGGAHRGRGGLRRGELPGGGAYNLDNRPRAVKADVVEFDSQKDEALRQHLIGIGEFTSIEPDATGTAQTITFKDRLTAERFFYGPRHVPGVGDLELTWAKSSPSTHHKTSHDVDADMGDAGDQSPGQNHEADYSERARENGAMDYDEAEDEER